MAHQLITIPWTSQPTAGTQLNRRNPLTNGLTVAFCGNHEPRTRGSDWVSTSRFVPTARGMAAEPPDTTNKTRISSGAPVVIDAVNKFVASEEVSTFILAYRHTDNESIEEFGSLIYNTNQSVINYYMQFEFGFWSSSPMGGAMFVNPTPWSNSTDKSIHSVSYSGKDGLQRAFNDGRFITQGTSAFTPPTLSSIDNLTLATNATVGVLAFYVWDRFLSDEEHAAIAIDPWQIFEPQQIPIFIPSATTIINESITLGANQGLSLDYLATLNKSIVLGANQGLNLSRLATLNRSIEIGNILDLSATELQVILTITLVDVFGNTLNNLSNIKWAWFDNDSPSSFSSPVLSGSVESTDANGVLTIDLTGTSLTTGQTGSLIVFLDGKTDYALHRITL